MKKTDENKSIVNNNKKTIKDNQNKLFIINNTEYPDLYELYNLDNSYDSYACIPNINISKIVRLWFKNNKN